MMNKNPWELLLCSKCGINLRYVSPAGIGKGYCESCHHVDNRGWAKKQYEINREEILKKRKKDRLNLTEEQKQKLKEYHRNYYKNVRKNK